MAYNWPTLIIKQPKRPSPSHSRLLLCPPENETDLEPVAVIGLDKLDLNFRLGRAVGVRDAKVDVPRPLPDRCLHRTPKLVLQ